MACSPLRFLAAPLRILFGLDPLPLLLESTPLLLSALLSGLELFAAPLCLLLGLEGRPRRLLTPQAAHLLHQLGGFDTTPLGVGQHRRLMG